MRPGLVTLAVLAGCAVVVWVAASWEPPPTPDLRVYRDAAGRLLDHLAVYPPGSRYEPGQPLPFLYPPFAALVLVPLAVVPVGSATAAWWLLNLLCLVWLLARAFAPALGRLSPVGRGAATVLLAVASVLLLAPVYRVFTFGQVGLVLAVLCIVDLDLAVRRPRRAGVLVGVAAAVKLTPAAFALTLLASGRRRAAVVAGATCVALWVLTAALLPTDTRDWLVIAAAQGTVPVDAAVNTTWQGLWLRLLGESPLTTVLWVSCGVGTLVVGAVRSGGLLRAGHALTAATVIGLAAILASPIAWIHHAVWVVPLLGIVLDDARSWRRWLLTLAVAAVFSGPATAWQDLDLGTPELAGVLDWLWVNTCVLVMAAAVALLRPGPATRPTSGPAGSKRAAERGEDDRSP